MSKVIRYTDLYYLLVDKFDCPFPRLTYNKFLIDVLSEFSKMIVEGHILRVPHFGTYVISRITPEPFKDKDGVEHTRMPINAMATQQLRLRLKPDWKKEDWATLPKEERPYVYYDNELTDGDILKVRWMRKYAALNCPYLWSYGFKLGPSHGRWKIREQLLKGTKYFKDEQVYQYKFIIRKSIQEAATLARSQQSGRGGVDMGSNEEDGSARSVDVADLQLHTNREQPSDFTDLY